MKGKISVYFAVPNLGRLRSRLDNPPAELTSEIRAELTKIAVEELNKANLSIRARMVKFIDGRNDLTFKTEAHQTYVQKITNGIFDSVFAATSAELNAITGDEAAEAGEATTEAGDTTAAPEAQDDKVTKGKGKSTPAAAPAADEDFKD